MRLELNYYQMMVLRLLAAILYRQMGLSCDDKTNAHDYKLVKQMKIDVGDLPRDFTKSDSPAN